MSKTAEIINNTKCFHCGLDCDKSIMIDDKSFCCTGCKSVYEILSGSGLGKYYSLDSTPGIRKEDKNNRFDYLLDDKVFKKLIRYSDEEIALITFNIPQMHCSSCIWLLENLYKLTSAVNESKVNFLRKTVTIKFYYKILSLHDLVILLTSIGYEPLINLEMFDEESVTAARPEAKNKQIHYRLGVAGFCFGNIMLLSFPEYLSIPASETGFRFLFLYLNLLLSLPVFFYSASGYFISAWKSLRKGIINIDFPLSLGILVLFLRSVYELTILGEAGYFDSLAGLVFFLLLGKLFQSKTYEALNFERNYKSYFPLAVIKINNGEEKSIPVTDLVPGDRIILRNNEIIPADSVLIKGDANIDYSFVTGESTPVAKNNGEVLFAGGKQIGAAIELEIIKEVSQSYLTELWKNSSFLKPAEGNFTIFSNTFSGYFTYAILLISLGAALLQMHNGLNTALNVFTAVLIVACPCALAMSVPFTFGNALRIMGRNKFYLKSIRTIEEIAKTDTIVFDKTGTLTKTGEVQVHLKTEINDFQRSLVKSLVRNSSHPLSKKILEYLDNASLFDVKEFVEIPNLGIKAEVLGQTIMLGSRNFVSVPDEEYPDGVHFSIDGEYTGVFVFNNVYREGITDLLNKLRKSYSLYVLTGDNENEKDSLLKLFPDETTIKFRFTPGQKLSFIKKLQNDGRKVMMIGDGLNDAGALSQSDTGISLTENISNFTPASDAILEAGSLRNLMTFLNYSKISVKLIYISYAISLMYNLVGLTFAVQGLLTPIIAAILMPVSSISVVLFATAATNFAAGRKGLLSLS